MFDGEFAQWLLTLGVGGVLAGFMFFFYRKDVRQYTDLWKDQSSVLIGVVKENTASNTKLISMIDTLQRDLWTNHDRRSHPRNGVT
jgi:hypothetical protein